MKGGWFGGEIGVSCGIFDCNEVGEDGEVDVNCSGAVGGSSVGEIIGDIAFGDGIGAA